MDRRKLKSRNIIMDAFLALLKEHEFAKISMNDIAEKANVNRGTIYLNFIDKYDLLDQCIAANFSQMIDECRHAAQTKQPLTRASLLASFVYLESHSDFLRSLIQHVGFSSFGKCMSIEIAAILRQHAPSEVSVQFWTSAIIGVLEWWLEQAMPCTPEQITDELWQLLQHHPLSGLAT